MLGEWLVLVEYELLLFAGIFFLLGALDEIAVDLAWLWLRATGRACTPPMEIAPDSPIEGPAAVFIPTWQEAAVISATVGHALAVWKHEDLRLYVGCYRNDPATTEAAVAAAIEDSRLRLVIHERHGPSTKADCLNRLYRALRDDERRSGRPARMVILHDAEDMVDPAALSLLDWAIREMDLVQLPVLPVPVAYSRWISGHYCEEFAEAHGKAMVVRDAMGAGIPLAGVGCAIGRQMLEELARLGGADGPFATDCLTEDYELGLRIASLGGKQRFLRRRDGSGRLIATRACFPTTFDHSVRQKARWIHGIAFQGWDRLGWSSRPSEVWMRLRDRRVPLAAMVLLVAYAMIVLATLGWLFEWAGYGAPLVLSPFIEALLWANLASFIWRAAWRLAFTAREYGPAEGFFALLRIPLTNMVAIAAGHRAIVAYSRTLAGQLPRWEKTQHNAHPALYTNFRNFT